MDLLVVALALVLGFVLGTGVGAARAFRLAAQRRSIAGANAGLARLFPTELPQRSSADIIAGRIRIVLGGQVFVLPVLPIAAAERWLADLDASFAHLADELDTAGDDKPRILALLSGQSRALLAMLRAYDQTGVLPEPAFIDEFATSAEVLVAMVEVWRATSPLVATLIEGIDGSPTDGSSSEATSGSRPTTAGTPEPFASA